MNAVIVAPGVMLWREKFPKAGQENLDVICWAQRWGMPIDPVLKILEALACGLPVVSTKVGAEGLLLKPGEDYVQAEEDVMAKALVQAIRHPAALQTMAQHGRRIVLDTYDWEVLAMKLEASWEKSLRKSLPV